MVSYLDKNIECSFVQTFIQKRIQERIIWELASVKKRKTAIWRFCHTTDDIVKPQLVLIKSNKLTNSIILQSVSELTTLTSCYIISFYEEIDGKQMTITNAVSHCIGRGLPSIIIIGEQVAIIETEQSIGASIKYILHAVLQ